MPLRRDFQPAHAVRLVLTNDSSKPTRFALEPVGDECKLEPGQSAVAQWEPGSSNLELNIVLQDDGVWTWDESTGGGGLDPVRSERGGEHWAPPPGA